MLTSAEIADEELVSRAARGDRAALERLIDRHHDAVYSMALTFTRNPHEAEDLAQEAWVKAVRGLSGFQGRSRFTTWMYPILRNTFLNMRERLGTRTRREVELDDAPRHALEDPVGERPEEQAAREDTGARVRDAIRDLPEEFRCVVVLRFFFDLSYKEIAEQLEVPLGTVQSRLKRGIDRLSAVVRGWEEFAPSAQEHPP